jgi:topoisomerase-4 subunit B
MSYTAESIAVLKGLEPVRHRPGMYTRTDCPLHILQEAIDNAADEAHWAAIASASR